MTRLRGSSGDEERDMQLREDLLEASLAQVFTAYDAGFESGMIEPTVVLLDCEDEIGNPIAREWLGASEVDKALSLEPRKQRRGEETTTLAMSFPFDESSREIPAVFEYLRGTFAEPPPDGGFIAVVVAAGGAATFTVPLDARPGQ